MDPSSAWQTRRVGVVWDTQEMGGESGGRRIRVCVREGEIEGWGWGAGEREKKKKKAAESIHPLTSLGLVPVCAALRSRLSRNHFSCSLERPHGRSYGAAEVLCGHPVFLFCSKLRVLSHISVNCLHTLCLKREERILRRRIRGRRRKEQGKGKREEEGGKKEKRKEVAVVPSPSRG